MDFIFLEIRFDSEIRGKWVQVVFLKPVFKKVNTWLNAK